MEQPARVGGGSRLCGCLEEPPAQTGPGELIDFGFPAKGLSSPGTPGKSRGLKVDRDLRGQTIGEFQTSTQIAGL